MKRSKIFAYSLALALSGTEAAAGEADDIANLYREQAFEKACKEGMRLYYGGRKEPHFAAMVGMACARVDAINPLGVLQRNLVDSPALRSSATYFATLVLAKRLLYQHFIDGISLQAFSLPSYDHILCFVFDAVRRGEFAPMGPNMIGIDRGMGRIIVSVSDDVPARLLIDEYDGSQLKHRHWFQ